jgi:hypothetical protein
MGKDPWEMRSAGETTQGEEMKVTVKRIRGAIGEQLKYLPIDSVRVDGKEVAIIERVQGAKLSFLQDIDPTLYGRIHRAVVKIRSRQGLPPPSPVVLAPPDSSTIRQYAQEQEWRRRGMAPPPESEDPDYEFEESYDE